MVTLLVACTPVQQLENSSPSEAVHDDSASSSDSLREASQIIVPDTIPAVDLTKHSVALEEVYFDTFQPTNRAVPLSDADPVLIEQLRDAIPPIHSPAYEKADEATWLSEEDMVIGYAIGDKAWAYPVRILNFHEIVNEHLGGDPLVISYCPLCYSGVVFSRVLERDDGSTQLVTFGNTSALYESDMVMLDYETGSYWWHVAGRAIVGELTDAELTVLPSMTVPWAQWQELYPNTLVLSRNTGFQRDYSRDPFTDIAEYFNAGRFAFPVSEKALDPRLQPGDEVLSVRVNNEVRAYPIAQGNSVAIGDTVGGEEIVVFIDPNQGSGAAFDPTVDRQTLTFEPSNARDSQWRDTETGSHWTLAGRAVSGRLKGTELRQIPAKLSFWFAVVASEPDIVVYQ